MVNQLVKTLVQGETDKREYFLVKHRDQTGKLVPLDLTGKELSIIIYDVKRENFIIHESLVVQDISIATNACYYDIESESTEDYGNFLGRLIISSGSQITKSVEFQWNVEKVPPEPSI
jgi:hypothetical protein